MIQIAFQPAVDPYHTVFRLLRLRSMPVDLHQGLPVDQLRMLDFYLLFPKSTEKIRVSPKHRGIRTKAAAAAPNQYGGTPDEVTLFARMETIQLAALDTLAAKGLVDRVALDVGRVTYTESSLPKTLETRITALNKQDSSLLEFLKLLVTEYEFLGLGGLKDRTGLMEYRHDAA